MPFIKGLTTINLQEGPIRTKQISPGSDYLHRISSYHVKMGVQYCILALQSTHKLLEGRKGGVISNTLQAMYMYAVWWPSVLIIYRISWIISMYHG